MSKSDACRRGITAKNYISVGGRSLGEDRKGTDQQNEESYKSSRGVHFNHGFA